MYFLVLILIRILGCVADVKFLTITAQKRKELLRELITAGNRLWVDCRALMMRSNLQGGPKPDQFNSVYSSCLWYIERRSLYQKCSVFMWSISRILNIAKFKNFCTHLFVLKIHLKQKNVKPKTVHRNSVKMHQWNNGSQKYNWFRRVRSIFASVFPENSVNPDYSTSSSLDKFSMFIVRFNQCPPSEICLLVVVWRIVVLRWSWST